MALSRRAKALVTPVLRSVRGGVATVHALAREIDDCMGAFERVRPVRDCLAVLHPIADATLERVLEAGEDHRLVAVCGQTLGQRATEKAASSC